ncbi:unnamed protein product [Trichogramma brassicae]|uniref:Integrase zinc-binding domain-containing protein n=1 Tax=Trichogramma brassicae TaxID=86971 RepID=A0A6H5IU24_9HYME|nr:unnamed protein product [Trichogramma brassicae]
MRGRQGEFVTLETRWRGRRVYTEEKSNETGVQFLGYVLDSSGLRIDSERVRPIHDLSDSEKRKTSKTVAWHGHLGAKKTYDRLACEYWWPGMWYAVEEYCNSCDVCQRYKVPQTGPKGLMTRRVVDRPWAVVAADMMEFPRSKKSEQVLAGFSRLVHEVD